MARHSSDRPNILLLTTDQQRFDTLRCAGYPHMHTPNLDRLAASGRRYTHAHSATPVCQPARHDLLTGMPPRRHGYFSNQNTPIADYSLPTLPRLLSQAGYVTAAIGKMHFRPVREHHGFSEMHLMEELPRWREEDAYLTYLKEQGYGDVRHIHGVRHALYHRPQRALMPEEHHGCAWVAKRTMQFIDQNRSRPWFVWASWISPHPPFNVPASFQGLYEDAELPEATPPSREFPLHASPSPWFGDDEEPGANRRMREAYYSMISLIDKHLGRLLDHLEETGQAENTLIIFTSDHGEMLGDKGLYQKALPYDPAVRVPFLLSFPGRVKPGEVCDDFVDLFDILPTCLDAAGVSYPGGSPPWGESLLNPEGRRDRNYQWAACNRHSPHRWTMCRDRRYKFVHWFARGYEALYDLVEDPHETRNLLTDGRAPQDARLSEVYHELRARALAFEEAGGPQGSVVDGRFVDFEGAGPFAEDDQSKYPLWAHRQFPTWGDGSREAEAGLMAAEMVRSVDGDFSGLCPDPRWRGAWRDAWLALGGDPALADRVLGNRS